MMNSDNGAGSDADGKAVIDTADPTQGKQVAKVRHPILRLEVLHPDGSRTSEHRVFCRYQKKSVPVGICCACVHCDSIETAPGRGASVNCTITLDAADTMPDPLGVRTEVGTVLRRGTLVLDPSSTLKQAFELLRTEDRRSLPVVDAKTSIVGVIHETAFLPTQQRSSDHPPPRHREDPVAHAMSGSLAIHEAVPIRRALEMLAAAHLREATVVDSEGVPLGVFHDIDGLRWIYASRSAEWDPVG